MLFLPFFDHAQPRPIGHAPILHEVVAHRRLHNCTKFHEFCMTGSGDMVKITISGGNFKGFWACPGLPTAIHPQMPGNVSPHGGTRLRKVSSQLVKGFRRYEFFSVI